MTGLSCKKYIWVCNSVHVNYLPGYGDFLLLETGILFVPKRGVEYLTLVGGRIPRGLLMVLCAFLKDKRFLKVLFAFSLGNYFKLAVSLQL